MNPTVVHGHSFINLTPHPVSWKTPDGEVHTVPPVTPGSPSISVESVTRPLSWPNDKPVGGIPCQTSEYGEVVGLPDWDTWKDTDVHFIVSGLILNAIKEKREEDGSKNPQPREIWLTFVAPATGPKDGAHRNSKGQVEWVTRWNVVSIP